MWQGRGALAQAPAESAGWVSGGVERSIPGGPHGRSELRSCGLAHGRERLPHGSGLAGRCGACLRAGRFPCQGSEG